LGLAGLLLAGLTALALLILGAREIAAIARQRHITNLHIEFAKARAADDRNSARKLIRELSSLYTTRPETAQARAHLRDLTQEIVDGRDLIDIAERTLVEPIDAKVRAGIASAARRVSMVTALAPRAVIDVLFVAAQSIYLIRLISMLYGGRPGVFGFLKLLRSVGTHIAITGGMAATDTILQQVIGHGIAAKLSAKLGEGVLNGLLTARVGLSAMAVCRPLPFGDGKAPSLGDVAPFLFKAEKTQANE
jgi:putative membrane protein